MRPMYKDISWVKSSLKLWDHHGQLVTNRDRALTYAKMEIRWLVILKVGRKGA